MILQGAMTALVTPMRDGAVDQEALAALVEEQIEAGIDAIVAVGTTGESATLDTREHIEVVRSVVKLARGRVPVIAGAGGNATAEALALSRESEKAGADALLHVTPYYNKPTQEGLYRHFEAIAKATALPVVLYNVPGRTACDLLPETIARLAELDTVVAIKDATADLRRASDTLRLCGDRIALLSGDDFTAFPLLALGGRGVISVVSNVMPRQVAQMCDAALAGDWDAARRLHYAIMPLTELLFVEPNPIAVKAALALRGMIRPDIRLPMVPASPELTARLEARLREDGLL